MKDESLSRRKKPYFGFDIALFLNLLSQVEYSKQDIETITFLRFCVHLLYFSQTLHQTSLAEHI